MLIMSVQFWTYLLSLAYYVHKNIRNARVLLCTVVQIKNPKSKAIGLKLPKGGKFLKKLWCCVGGSIAR